MVSSLQVNKPEMPPLFFECVFDRFGFEILRIHVGTSMKGFMAAENTASPLLYHVYSHRRRELNDPIFHEQMLEENPENEDLPEIDEGCAPYRCAAARKLLLWWGCGWKLRASMCGLPSVHRGLRPCSPANCTGHLTRQAGAVVLARFRFLGPRRAGNPHSNKLSRRLRSIPACLQSPCLAVLAAAERRRAPCWELLATTAAAHRRSPVRGSQEKFQAYIGERGFSQSAADFLIRSILTQVRVPLCAGASAHSREPTRPRPSSARRCANRTHAYCVRGAVVPRLHELSVRGG